MSGKTYIDDIVIDKDRHSVTAKLADHTPHDGYEKLTDAVSRIISQDDSNFSMSDYGDGKDIGRARIKTRKEDKRMAGSTKEVEVVDEIEILDLRKPGLTEMFDI